MILAKNSFFYIFKFNRIPSNIKKKFPTFSTGNINGWLRVKHLIKNGHFQKLRSLIDSYLKKKNLRELISIAKKIPMQIYAKDRSKNTLIWRMTEVIMIRPSLLKKLEINLFKNKIVTYLKIALNPNKPDDVSLIGVTENNQFCLQDLFRVQSDDLKKSSMHHWQETRHFKNLLKNVEYSTPSLGDTPEIPMYVKESIKLTLVHRSIAIEAARYRGQSLEIAFNKALETFKK